MYTRDSHLLVLLYEASAFLERDGEAKEDDTDGDMVVDRLALEQEIDRTLEIAAANERKHALILVCSKCDLVSSEHYGALREAFSLQGQRIGAPFILTGATNERDVWGVEPLFTRLQPHLAKWIYRSGGGIVD